MIEAAFERNPDGSLSEEEYQDLAKDLGITVGTLKNKYAALIACQLHFKFEDSP